MPQINCHIPITVRITGELTDPELDRLGDALTRAIATRIVFAERSISSGHAEVRELDREAVREPYSPARYRPQDRTYAVPGFDNGGAPTPLPVKSPPAAPKPAAPTGQGAAWTPQRIAQHILSTFGTYGPTGQTHYAVQTPAGIFYVTDVVNGQPVLGMRHFRSLKKDVEGHLTLTGEETRYGQGRFVFRVTGPAEGEHPYQPFVGNVTDLEGNVTIKTVYTDSPVGYQLVIDVPPAPAQGAQGTRAGGAGGAAGGSPLGTGVLPRSGWLIYLQCHPAWDTGPLTDPVFAGMTDDDLFRLFLNLCNARAIHNLDLSEKYIRDQLVPLYTGPNGATNILSEYSRHNVQHFQEQLRLLRGLMLAMNKLDEDMKFIHAELDPLIMTHHRTRGQSMGFGARTTLEAYWPTYHPPAPEDRARVEELLLQLSEKGKAANLVMTGILALVRENPFLTQFVKGLEISGQVALAPDRTKIESDLADVASPEGVQKQVLEKLDDILQKIARAREKLCRDPERILDVPLVYEKVLHDLEGINPRFDQAAQAGIQHHQRQQAWIDIGLSAVGLVLFVGGLIVSAFGGPAGVVAFLELSGTALGAITAIRSIDRADFLTAVAGASVEQGAGMVTLEAARQARFWAAIDTALVAVDATLGAIKAARAVAGARRAEALARLSRGAEEFGETVQAGQRIPFDELFRRAAPRGQLPLSQAELAQLQQAVGAGIQGTAVTGRIAEEVAVRTVQQTGEYVTLATRLPSNQGIDFLFVRRSVFEGVFGRLSDPRDASRLFAGAAEAQRQQFIQAIRRSSNAQDLISMEVKFARAGESVEEVLKAARGGVSQDRVWFQSVVANMRRVADPEVQATGRLLEDIIGANAQNIERLTRVGISMDTSGAFKLTELTDQIIADANRAATLYRSPRFHGLVSDLLRAERAGRAARAQTLRARLAALQAQIDTLDAAVRQAKQAQAASRQAQQALQRVGPALADLQALSTAAPTPSTLDALYVLNGTVRAHVEAAKHAIDQADAGIDQVRKTVADAQQKQPKFEAAVEAAIEEWDRIEPGARERITRAAETQQGQPPPTGKE